MSTTDCYGPGPIPTRPVTKSTSLANGTHFGNPNSAFHEWPGPALDSHAMSALSMNSVESPRHYALFPPLPSPPRHLNQLLFKSRKFFQSFSISLILRNFMADSEPRSVDSYMFCVINSENIEFQLVNSCLILYLIMHLLDE